MISVAPRVRKPSIFISFCQTDIEFVDRLVEELERDGQFELFIDPDLGNNASGWRNVAGPLVEAADTLVFVQSPSSVQSEACLRELECALEISKRAVSLLLEPIDARQLQSQIARFKQVRFDGRRDFNEALNELLTVLSGDIEWLLDHTQLYVRAREWDKSGRSADKLLTGAEILAAKIWTFERPNCMPKPTDLHLDFIGASEANYTAQVPANDGRTVELEEQQAPTQVRQPEDDKKPRWLRNAFNSVVASWLSARSSESPASAQKQVIHL